MANIFRLAKSGSDWTSNELLAYNITIERQDALRFFGHDLGTIDHLDPDLLTSADYQRSQYFQGDLPLSR